MSKVRNMTAQTYQVAVPQVEYNDLLLRLSCGETVSLTDAQGDRHPIYLKDGKIYDTDRLRGKFDYDREVVGIDEHHGESKTKWARFNRDYGPPIRTTVFEGFAAHEFRDAAGRKHTLIVRK